jgi:hypothetical protein
MHIRRKSTPTERALASARVTATDLGNRAGETAQQWTERAQTTVVPAVEQAARTASERMRNDVQPAVAAAAGTVAASATVAAEAAREEARLRSKDARERGQQALKDAEKRTRKTRKEARKRGLLAADRARTAVGLQPSKPERHWLRNIAIALGLIGVAAFVASKAGSTTPEPVRIPTTPTPHAPGANGAPAAVVVDEEPLVDPVADTDDKLEVVAEPLADPADPIVGTSEAAEAGDDADASEGKKS